MNIISLKRNNMTQQTDHVPEVRKKVVTAVELLHENNIAICEMLLYGKIGDTQYEQLINCFSINLEQAKAMENEQLNIARLDGINLANKGYGK